MASQAKQVGDALRKFVERVAVAIAVNVTTELRRVTPIDTGWARSNWIPLIGRPRPNTAGTRESVDYTAQTVSLAEVLAFKLRDKSIYVTNNVPYIRNLNAGSSAQAPAGYVDATIARTVQQSLATVARQGV